MVMTLRSLAAVLVLAAAAHAQGLDLRAVVAGRAAVATGPPSWLEGDFGRLDLSGDGIGEGRLNAFATADVGLDWAPSPYFLAHVHALARAEPADYGGERAGLVAAFAQLHLERGNHSWQLRGGQFFLPTSRENKGDLWSSPYTINVSALNTWIGQEFRPIGVDFEWRKTTAAGHVITGAASAFQGNDSSGALVAWRGWTVGNRLSLYDEVVPLPPLHSFDVMFVQQRKDGSKPFGTDLDGRYGYAARARYSLPERAMVQIAHVDNRGDLRLHRGEYAWDTRFHIISAEVGQTDRTIVAAEWTQGATAMGFPQIGVDASFYAGYLLASHKTGRHRLSARFDIFQTEDRDQIPIAETNDELGRSWTLAYLFDVRSTLRAAIEFTQITGNRLAASQAGFDADTNGQSVTLELRYSLR